MRTASPTKSSIKVSGSTAREIVTNPKSTHELVMIVRNEFKECKFISNGYAGICDCIHSLYQQKIISGIEYSKIHKFLLDNRPEYTKHRSAYWWKAYDKKPRLKFLESLINSNRN